MIKRLTKLIGHVKKELLSSYRRNVSPLKKAWHAGFVVGAIILVCALALLLFPGPLVNWFIKPRIAEALAEAYPAYLTRISDEYRVEFPTVTV